MSQSENNTSLTGNAGQHAASSDARAKNVEESLFIVQELGATASVLPFPSVSFFPDGSDRVL